MRIAYLHAIRDSHLLMAGDSTHKPVTVPNGGPYYSKNL